MASTDYADLRRQLTEQGLFQGRPLIAFASAAIMVLLGVAGAWLAVRGFPYLGGLLFGVVSTQMALIGHDLGHGQFGRGKSWTWLARVGAGNLGLGVSQSWWVDKHNRHHASPNHEGKDPDLLQPFGDVTRPGGTWKHRLGVAVYLPFQAINARISSLKFIFREKPQGWQVELAVMALHFVIYGFLLSFLGFVPALLFVVTHQALFGIYNSLIFATNHKGMPIFGADEAPDFMTIQVATSRNVMGSPIVDWVMGGLNYQIEHHLFPTMPRHRLKQANAAVRAYCRERGYDYTEENVRESYRDVFKALGLFKPAQRAGA